ncbi:MAG: histidine kinase N-terminal 7TM domain-containing protein [Anaerolineales bacterium]
MEFQSNPYLIWQLVPGIITLGIGLYIQSRPVKKRESNVFSVLMFGGSLWAFANAIQLLTPNPGWQKIWNYITFLGIMTVPTAWFLLSVKLTGFIQQRVEKVEKWFWALPAILYLLLLTTGFHKLFFTSFEIVNVGGYASLENSYGPLFFVHTGYSYLLMISGIVILGVSLVRNFRRYGIQAYGLIVGVLAPLIGNAYFIFGSPPAGFPDPTPIIFTVTGVAFAWAIFGGHILEVVPLAHDVIVQKLSTGIVILDLEKNIRDINPAAIDILGLLAQNYVGHSFPELVKKNPAISETILTALSSPSDNGSNIQITNPKTGRVFDTLIYRVDDRHGNLTGRLIQLSDISEKIQAEANLVTVQETLESVLDTLQDSYFEADAAGVITYANTAFIKALGFAEDEVIGKHFRHFTQRKSVRDIFQKFSQVIETKTPLEPFRYDYRAKDDRIYMAETTVSPIIEGETVIGTRGVMREITDRVMAEEALRQTKEEAETRAEQLAAINRISMIVNQSLNLDDILQALCLELTKIFPIRNAGIGLLGADKESLEIVAFHALDPAEKSALGMVLPFEGNPSSQEVIEKKKTVVVQDAQNDPRMSSLADISRSRGTKSIMIVPLLTRGEAIGTIGMPARDPQYVFTQNELDLAGTIASQIAAAIDNARLYARTELALDVAERDLEIGRQIQSGFFPEELPEIPGWEIAAHFHAARQVAGDFYDAFQFRNSKLTAFVIADVCDKGVGAALFMVLFRSLLRAFSERKVDVSNVEEHLLRIILNTNNFIAEYHGRSNMFATLFFGILDPDSGVLYYVNGGHEPPVIMDKDGAITRRLMPTGPAVGLFPDLEFQVEQIQMEVGDLLVGFTDGATDAKNSAGELFSEERLLTSIASPWTSIFSMFFELTTALQKHIGKQKQFDDITLISFRRKLTPDIDHHAICRVARLDVLGELRNFAEQAATHSGLNHDDIFAYKLATEEICTNIIQYGYEGVKPGLISLFFDVEGNVARLTIRDDGKYFSPEQAESPNIEAGLDEREIGGLGIYLVKELMDNVTYNKTDENINQFILEKELK